MTDFAREVQERIAQNGHDIPLRQTAHDFLMQSLRAGYSYNFSWLSRPIIQYPQDMAAMQEIIWAVRPDLILETGIAHGGSLIFSASMLALLDLCEAIEAGRTMDPRQSSRRVIGLDIDIRAHNRAAIEAHPMASRITMIEGSSVAPEVVAKVRAAAAGHSRVMVCLDSMHTQAHVLAELEAYAPLVTPGSYCVVFDTVVEDMPPGSFPDRPWDKGDNPKTAVWEFLKAHPEFAVDRAIQDKLLLTVAPDGFLRRMG
ncbi:MAG: cephalosporin hydroxylase family protein [Desulfovibrionaceae bacterium]|jgi:cephalosporin hydroxylase|nr:cephalosporin hydroxylase family protein [Desulfovibrionaceae bacterium]